MDGKDREIAPKQLPTTGHCNATVDDRTLVPRGSAGISIYLSHINNIVDQILLNVEHLDVENLTENAEKLRSTTYGLACIVRSTEPSIRHEEELWTVARKLWDLSTQTSQYSHSELLHALGSEIFDIISNPHNETSLYALSKHVEYFCKLGEEWERLDQPQRASFCISKAALYCKQLEGAIAEQGADSRLPLEYSVILFTCYLLSAKHANLSHKESLANNMVAKALDIVESIPKESAEMRYILWIDVANFFLQQAGSLLSTHGNANKSKILHALTSAEKYVEKVSSSSSSSSSHALPYQSNTILADLQAQLAVLYAALWQRSTTNEIIDQNSVIRRFEKLGETEILNRFSTLGSFLVMLYLAVGNIPRVASLLRGAVTSPVDHSVWLDLFGQLLRNCSDEKYLHLITNIAMEFVRTVTKTTTDAVERSYGNAMLQALLKVILSIDSHPAAETVCIRVLASNEVVAHATADHDTADAFHQMLSGAMAVKYNARAFNSCVALLTAALQYAATPDQYQQSAVCLASCYLHLSNYKKALEYLEVSKNKKKGVKETSYACVIRFAALVASHAPQQKIKNAVEKLVSCDDFHYSIAHTAVQIARHAGSPLNEIDATSLVLKYFVPANDKPTKLPPGQEAHLIKVHISSIYHQIQFLKNPDIVRYRQEEIRGLFKELAATFKLSTQRLHAIGFADFAENNEILDMFADIGYHSTYIALHHGVFDESVTLASSTVVLLEHLDGVVPARSTLSKQVAVLVIAVQSLLKASSTPQKPACARLKLASTLIRKAMGKCKGGTASRLLTCHLLNLEVASKSGNEKCMLESLRAINKSKLNVLQAFQVLSVAHACRFSGVKKLACSVVINTAAEALSMDSIILLMHLAQDAQQQLLVLETILNTCKALDKKDLKSAFRTHWVVATALVRAASLPIQFCDTELLEKIYYEALVIPVPKLRAQAQAALEIVVAAGQVTVLKEDVEAALKKKDEDCYYSRECTDQQHYPLNHSFDDVVTATRADDEVLPVMKSQQELNPKQTNITGQDIKTLHLSHALLSQQQQQRAPVECPEEALDLEPLACLNPHAIIHQKPPPCLGKLDAEKQKPFVSKENKRKLPTSNLSSPKSLEQEISSPRRATTPKKRVDQKASPWQEKLHSPYLSPPSKKSKERAAAQHYNSEWFESLLRAQQKGNGVVDVEGVPPPPPAAMMDVRNTADDLDINDESCDE